MTQRCRCDSVSRPMAEASLLALQCSSLNALAFYEKCFCRASHQNLQPTFGTPQDQARHPRQTGESVAPPRHHHIAEKSHCALERSACATRPPSSGWCRVCRADGCRRQMLLCPASRTSTTSGTASRVWWGSPRGRQQNKKRGRPPVPRMGTVDRSRFLGIPPVAAPQQ